MDAVELAIKQLYGVQTECAPLIGEREQNVLVLRDGSPWTILKISHPAENKQHADFQSKLLQHLHDSAPMLPVPRLVPLKSGKFYQDFKFPNGQRCELRLITFKAGHPLPEQSPHLGKWARRVGKLQGQLCKALSNFEHPAARAFMPWNATSKFVFDDRTLSYLGPECFALLTPHLDRLEAVSLPRLQQMRSQVIHNDIHTGNILLDEEMNISSVIDFGDAIHAPLVQEIAVSAVSLVEMDTKDPIQKIKDLICGFCSEVSLTPEELMFLHDAMILRSILNVALGRLKDQFGPTHLRPRAATIASERALHRIVSLKDNGHFNVA